VGGRGGDDVPERAAGPHQLTGEKRKSNFIDPDDMVEEKVELSFENVVVTPSPKKKKKSLL